MSAADDTTPKCAACGENVDGQKVCSNCNTAKYCNRECQKNHWPAHKKECKKIVAALKREKEEEERRAAQQKRESEILAAKLHDEDLFKDPPPSDVCTICSLAMPLDGRVSYQPCCGQILCAGCAYVVVTKTDMNMICPFCRSPKAITEGQQVQRFMKRAEGEDVFALHHLGCYFAEGRMGLPRDYGRAMSYWLRAGELGHAAAYYNIAVSYDSGEGVEKDVKKARQYLELAAMGGNAISRHNLGAYELHAGNVDRAMKHFMISAVAGFDESLEIIKDGFKQGVVTKDDFAKALRAHQKANDARKSAQREAAAAAFAKRPPSTIPGIENLGNTCYLSASLQALFSVPQFLSDLYKTYEKEMTQSPTKKMPLTHAMLAVATVVGVLREEDVQLISAEVAESKLNAGNPEVVKTQMDVLTDKFAGYEQRDAHEFLGDLVDYLHDELAASPAAPEEEGGEAASTTAEGGGPGGEGNKNEERGVHEEMQRLHINGLPTDDYFHLNVRVTLKCDACGYSRSKDELYRHLSVDVGEEDTKEPDAWTVERSLQQFFKEEKRELNCEKCEDGKSATQSMEIISCPKALLLHFKRFIVTQEMRGGSTNGSKGEDGDKAAPPTMQMVLHKNKAKIPLKDSLSINQFVGKDEEKPSGKYHLRAVVHHFGNTAFSGHYTTCAKRTLADKEGNSEEKSESEEQWVFFDDQVGVKKGMDYVAGSENNQRNCYMALYELN